MRRVGTIEMSKVTLKELRDKINECIVCGDSKSEFSVVRINDYKVMHAIKVGNLTVGSLIVTDGIVTRVGIIPNYLGEIFCAGVNEILESYIGDTVDDALIRIFTNPFKLFQVKEC